MKVVQDDLRLCQDCTIAACNDDYSGLPEKQAEATREGLKRLGAHLVLNTDTETGDGYDEFSSHRCDCCLSHLAGSRYRFAILA